MNPKQLTNYTPGKFPIKKQAAEYLKLKKRNLSTKGISKHELQEGVEEEHEHTSNPRIAKQIAVDHLKEKGDYYTLLDGMEENNEFEKEHMKEAFERGFYKAASQAGLDLPQTTQLLKQAEAKRKQLPEAKPMNTREHESSAMGRWLAAKAQLADDNANHPWRSNVGRLGGLLPLTLAGGGLGALGGMGLGLNLDNADVGKTMLEGAGRGAALGALASLIMGHPEAGQQIVNHGVNPEGREQSMYSQMDRLKDKSYGSNIGSSALNLGLFGAAGGAGIGALGYMLNKDRYPNADLLKPIVIGAGIGGGGGALVGAGTGALASYIAKNTTQQTKDRMMKYKAEHPLGTAFPFGGDIAGAGAA